MWDLQQKGFATFDGADHYGPAEDLMGIFKEQYEKKFGEETLSANFQGTYSRYRLTNE